MFPNPKSDAVLLLRTDYADGAGWDDLLRQLGHHVEEFGLRIQPVSDETLASVGVEQILATYAERQSVSVVFVADARALADADHPVLVLDTSAPYSVLQEVPAWMRSFRISPDGLWSVAANLWVGNLCIQDFAEFAGPDGVYREA